MPDISLFRPTLNSFVAPADLNLINTQYNRLEQGHQQAVAQASAYEAALAQLDLNPAEDAWRQQQIASIRSALNDNMQFGNAYASLDDIVKTYGDVASNPGMIGRLRAQQDYKTYITNLENNKTLSQDTKDYYKALNTYRYQDRYDANGNIIGGTEWTPIEHETDTVDMAAVISNAISKLKPEGSQGDAFYYKTADGRFTTNRSESANGLPYFKTTSGYTQLSQERLREAILAEIDNTPGARASLEQDLKVGRWKHNRDGLEVSEVTDDLGNPLNFSQYLEKRISGVYHSVAYRNTTSKLDTSVGFSYDLEARKAELEVAKKRAINGLKGGGGYDTYGMASSAVLEGPQYKAKSNGIENIATLQNNAQTTIRDYADSLNIKYDSTDPNAIYELIKEAHATSGTSIPENVNAAYKSYTQQTEKLRQILGNQWDEYYGKLAVKAAIDSGSDMSALGDYAKDYIRIARETLASLGVTADSPGKLRINNVDVAKGQISDALADELNIVLKSDKQGYYYEVTNGNVENIGYIAQLLGDNANAPTFNIDLTPPENETFIERISRYLGSGKRIAGTKAGWDTTIFTNPLSNLQNYYKSLSDDISPLISDDAVIVSSKVYSYATPAELNAIITGENETEINNGVKRAQQVFNTSLTMYNGADHDIYFGGTNDSNASTPLEYVDDASKRSAIMTAIRAIRDKKPEYITATFDATNPQDVFIRFRIPKTTDNTGTELKEALGKAGVEVQQGKEYTIKADGLNRDVETRFLSQSPVINSQRSLYSDLNAGVKEFRGEDGGIVGYLGNDTFALIPDASDPNSSAHAISFNDLANRKIADDAVFELKTMVGRMIDDHRAKGTEITPAEERAINNQILDIVRQYGYAYNNNGDQTPDFDRVYKQLHYNIWKQKY